MSPISIGKCVEIKEILVSVRGKTNFLHKSRAKSDARAICDVLHLRAYLYLMAIRSFVAERVTKLRLGPELMCKS